MECCSDLPGRRKSQQVESGDYHHKELKQDRSQGTVNHQVQLSTTGIQKTSVTLNQRQKSQKSCFSQVAQELKSPISKPQTMLNTSLERKMGSSCQTSQTDFHPWDSHGRSRDLTAASYSLTYSHHTHPHPPHTYTHTHARARTHTHTHTHTHTRTHAHTHTHKHTCTLREREKTDRQTDRQIDRQTETESKGERAN